MKSTDTWKPTKYVPAKNGWRPSHDVAEVTRADRFIAGIQCKAYERLIRKHARGRLLDLGCGKIPLYGIYRAHVTECIGVDWPDTPHPSPHIDIEADLNGPLPFEDGRFDTILLTDVLEHIAEPALLWREMARILAPGGSIILAAPFMYCVHEAPHDYARHTEFALRRFCAQTGWMSSSLRHTAEARRFCLISSPSILAPRAFFRLCIWPWRRRLPALARSSEYPRKPRPPSRLATGLRRRSVDAGTDAAMSAGCSHFIRTDKGI